MSLIFSSLFSKATVPLSEESKAKLQQIQQSLKGLSANSAPWHTCAELRNPAHKMEDQLGWNQSSLFICAPLWTLQGKQLWWSFQEQTNPGEMLLQKSL